MCCVQVLDNPRFLDDPHGVAKELVVTMKDEEPDAYADNGAIARAIPLGNGYARCSMCCNKVLMNVLVTYDYFMKVIEYEKLYLN